MMGTEKFLQYFEATAGSAPSRFLRKDGSGSHDIAKANIKKLQMRDIYCLTGCNGKEYLVIPIGYTIRKIFVLLLSGKSKPKLTYFNRRFLLLGFSWLHSTITPVGLDELPLYIYHKYKTTFITNILTGITKIELPVSNKVIKSYTQAGIYNVEYAY
jgi:hypothetical protein